VKETPSHSEIGAQYAWQASAITPEYSWIIAPWLVVLSLNVKLHVVGVVAAMDVVVDVAAMFVVGVVAANAVDHMTLLP